MNKRLKSKAESIHSFFNDLKGFRFKEKILVIESDDWGSIRMPSKIALERVKCGGVNTDDCPFLSFDTMEKNKDIDYIGEKLTAAFPDITRRPVITANYILANPDYKKIWNSGFEEYHRKFFWDLLKSNDLLRGYKDSVSEGLKGGFFFPQLHGVEHVNIAYWLEILKGNLHPEVLIGFDNDIYGISKNVVGNHLRKSLLAAYDFESVSEFNLHIRPELEIANEMFKGFFGYYSRSFIAPNYFWSSEIEEVLSQVGVEYIQSSRKQNLPVAYGGYNWRYTGQLNEFNQMYLVRNCIFEPATVVDKSLAYKNAMNQIKRAFYFGYPAVISTHRVNFASGISEVNRNENVTLLVKLLQEVTRKWPNVLFMNSPQLGDCIKLKGYNV